MPGLTDWFDVFRCGTHLDHSGKWRTFTEADIDKAIASYQSDSAPIVVGHPTLNAPAFGWIQQFRRQGPTLQARASRVADEFADLVKRGLYKNRSISFNSDGTFRHVGFLGAAAPAVKGLEDIQFADKGEFITMDTAETVQTEQAAAQEHVEEVQVEPEAEVKTAESEAEVQSSRADAAPKTEPEVSLSNLESQQKQFQETVKKLESHIKSLENALNVEQEKNRKVEFAAYADELIRKGRLNPIAKSPLISTMERLFVSDQANFASPENSVLNQFKGLLNLVLPENATLYINYAAPSDDCCHSAESLTPGEVAIKARCLVDEQAAKGCCLDLGRAVRMVMEGGR